MHGVRKLVRELGTAKGGEIVIFRNAFLIPNVFTGHFYYDMIGIGMEGFYDKEIEGYIVIGEWYRSCQCSISCCNGYQEQNTKLHLPNMLACILNFFYYTY